MYLSRHTEALPPQSKLHQWTAVNYAVGRYIIYINEGRLGLADQTCIDNGLDPALN